ncbi:hypothetical protein [Meridianimarinicoccus roseus]|uniref:hypothetical protein n=1 Tax=Meridianimarinicoccus roseus TaxID=2072018 RepID=UPI0011B222AD|nr:hypothetical protein [Meridianimarinicoccus roseus]
MRDSLIPTVLPREADLPVEMDYEALRAIGMERIRAIAGRVWTDHNATDPGITLLEALAYAISDLGYRTGLPTVDLLTRPDGTIGPAAETGLHPPHEALPCAPLTVADWRMLMARVADVRNAWLDPMQDPARPTAYRLSEVPIYADCRHGELTEAADVDGHPTHPVRLSGLYRLRVALERDPVLGTLDETGLDHRFSAGPLKGASVHISSEPEVLAALGTGAAATGLDGSPVVEGTGPFTVRARLSREGGGTIDLDPLRVTVTNDRPRPTADPLVIDAATLAAALGAPDPGLMRFWDKQRRRRAALDRVASVFHANRALCEDALDIDTVAAFRVGVCADIDLAPDADIERVQAQIAHAIELYLSPPLAWRSLADLLDEGRPADEIYNGPYVDYGFTYGGAPVFTKHGFLTAEELAASDLRTEVHSSDVINLVADLDGVRGIRDLTLRAYDAEGRAVGPTQRWTLPVPPGHQPVLYLAGTKLVLYKDDLPYRAQSLEFRRTLTHLREMADAALYVPQEEVIPVPIGRYRNPGAAYSVQNDLPQTYGIGPAGLPPTAPPERIGQARQLKGWLAHLDWLIADYAGQLGAARRLLSPDPALAQSYFPGLSTDAEGTLGEYETEFFRDPARLADPLECARLAETEETFLDRRSRALDHLLARFSERFTDYALMSFDLDGGSLMTAREVIEDKAAFLAEAPRLGRERSAGFDYRPEDPARIWDTRNVPGLQARVARLLGIADPTRRDLHCAALFGELFEYFSSGGTRVRIRDGADKPLFVSDEVFGGVPAAREAARPIFETFRRAETFVVAEEAPGAFSLTLRAGSGAKLRHRTTFATRLEATRRARELVARHDTLLHTLCDDEGLHVIEHVLLRPRAPEDRLMQVCLPEDCAFCGEEDPYSFRVHIILPYWPSRFRDPGFRSYAERLIREETPAHIHPRICWVSDADMRALDRAWRGWLETQADAAASEEARVEALSRLIGVLEGLSTVNPAAVLHDCDEGDAGPIIRLGATNLGLF